MNENLTKFKEWLNQFQINKATTDLYIVVVRKFLNDKVKLTEQEVNLYLKKHPRLYVKGALKYYFKFKCIDIALPKIKEPSKKLIEEPDLPTLKSIVDVIQKKELRVILKILLDTGARISEVLKLKLNDVDLKAGVLHLRTKGEKYRDVRLTLETFSELESYINDLKQTGLLGGQKIFYTNYGSMKNSYKKLREEIDKTELTNKDILKRTHNFRRAVINFIIDKTDGNVATANAFIDHAKIETTMRYVSEKQRKKLKNAGEAVVLGIR